MEGGVVGGGKGSGLFLFFVYNGVFKEVFVGGYRERFCFENY